MNYDHLVDNVSNVLSVHLKNVEDVTRSFIFSGYLLIKTVHYENNALQELFDFLKQQDGPISIGDIERLEEISSQLKNACSLLSIRFFKRRIFKDFQKLSNEFIIRLRRLEQDYLREGNGIDTLTGLRSRKHLISDITRELSACERRGDSLGIVMASIDDYETLKKDMSAPDFETLIQFTSHILRQNMRVYDDGYLYKEGYFILCFKYTDEYGSKSAILRFITMLEEAQNNDSRKDKIQKILNRPLSASFIVTKLEPGQNISSLLKELEAKFKNKDTKKFSINEYKEKSELEIYLEKIQISP